LNVLVKRLILACTHNSTRANFLKFPKEIVWGFGVVLAGVLLTNGITHLSDSLPSLTVLFKAFHFSYFDSWGAMDEAYTWFKAHPYEKLYEGVFFGQQVKFQYPPSSLLPWYAADLVHLRISYYRLNIIGLLFFILSAVGTAMTAVEAASQLRWRPGDRLAQWSLGFLAAAVCLIYYPTIKAFHLGQIQAWLNCWLIWACYFWMKDKRIISGLLIGAVCLFKPQLGLFLVWAVLRREWRFLAGWAAIVVPGELAALTFFGWTNHMDYLKTLSFLGHRGEIYYANQSVNGLLNRLFGTAQGTLVWDTHGFPPYRPFVYYSTVLTSLVLLGLGLFRFIRRKATNIVDFMLAAVVFTIASPIAWEHHYGFMPVVFAVAFVKILTMPSAQRLTLLAIAFTLSASYLPAQLLPASGLAGLTQSYLFFGSLLLVLILYDLRDSFPASERGGEEVASSVIRNYIPKDWLGLPEGR
jgi:hypothetical protein